WSFRHVYWRRPGADRSARRGALAQPACPRPSSDPRKFCNLSHSTWHPPSAARTNSKATPQYGLQFRADHRIPVPLEILACKPVSVACELSLWSRLRRPPGNGFWTPETKGPKPPPAVFLPYRDRERANAPATETVNGQMHPPQTAENRGCPAGGPF